VRGLGHGQIWWADVDKVRPVLVLTRARVADKLTRVLVAPITTTVRDIATEVPLGPGEGVVDGSVANLDNAQLLGVDRLLRPAGKLPAERWDECCRAMAAVLGC
jgi:mRNA interferase MazF